MSLKAESHVPVPLVDFDAVAAMTAPRSTATFFRSIVRVPHGSFPQRSNGAGTPWLVPPRQFRSACSTATRKPFGSALCLRRLLCRKAGCGWHSLKDSYRRPTSNSVAPMERTWATMSVRMSAFFEHAGSGRGAIMSGWFFCAGGMSRSRSTAVPVILVPGCTRRRLWIDRSATRTTPCCAVSNLLRFAGPHLRSFAG